tara:strand:- start:3309 stop:3569 length:261 start_codon:yes stop_codon:yes gene_type:complete
MKLEISEEFLDCLDAVIIRIGYLYPDLKISKEDNNILIEHSGEKQVGFDKEVKQEIFMQLYREKIYRDTLPIKKWLFSEPKNTNES